MAWRGSARSAGGEAGRGADQHRPGAEQGERARHDAQLTEQLKPGGRRGGRGERAVGGAAATGGQHEGADRHGEGAEPGDEEHVAVVVGGAARRHVEAGDLDRVVPGGRVGDRHRLLGVPVGRLPDQRAVPEHVEVEVGDRVGRVADRRDEPLGLGRHRDAEARGGTVGDGRARRAGRSERPPGRRGDRAKALVTVHATGDATPVGTRTVWVPGVTVTPCTWASGCRGGAGAVGTAAEAVVLVTPAARAMAASEATARRARRVWGGCHRRSWQVEVDGIPATGGRWPLFSAPRGPGTRRGG